MISKDKTLYSYLLNILVDENCASAQLITSQDVSSLLKRIEKINLKSINIDPEISGPYLSKAINDKSIRVRVQVIQELREAYRRQSGQLQALGSGQ